MDVAGLLLENEIKVCMPYGNAGMGGTVIMPATKVDLQLDCIMKKQEQDI